MGKFDKTRLTVAEPAPVVDSDPHGKRWIGLAVMVAALIVGLCVARANPGAAPATWPAAGPSSVFGVSQCPMLDKCHVPTCKCAVYAPIPADEFVERALTAARKAGATDGDIEWMRNRWKLESWNNPRSISKSGDVGICQVNLSAHPEVDPVRLMTEPEYAGEVCFNIVRSIRVCGNWQHCCYRRGICGCQNWLKNVKGITVAWRKESDCRVTVGGTR